MRREKKMSHRQKAKLDKRKLQKAQGKGYIPKD
jgi:hypothetical protein